MRLPRSWRRLTVLLLLPPIGVSGIWAGATLFLSMQGHSRNAINLKLQRQWLLLKHPFRKWSRTYATAGKDLYETYCSNCHGLTGAGGRGPSLHGIDRNDYELVRTILTGTPGGMPPFETTLDVEQVFQVVTHLGVLADAPPLPMRGLASRGEALYRTRGDCHSCHDPGRDGGSIGPDLAGVGLRRGPDYLRAKLVDPGRDVAPSYRPVHVETTTGKSVTGRILNEDTFTVQIRSLDGAIHSYVKSHLVTYTVASGSSFMPSFGGVFSDEEIDDLVAYLSTQRSTN